MIEIIEKENWGGHQKRFRWLLNNILLLKEGERAIDVGCGSGLYITIPLNTEIRKKERKINVEGVDISDVSIEYAKENAIAEDVDATLFQRKSIYEIEKEYDAVICSEVLEHLCDEELIKFCTKLALMVKPGGMLLITVPNGKGSYEKGVVLWRKFQHVLDSKMMKKLRKFLRKIRDKSEQCQPMTVSDSPHIQFFDHETIVKMFECRGMKLNYFTGSNRFYNNFFDAFVPRINVLMKINNKLGDMNPRKAAGYYFKFIKE